MLAQLEQHIKERLGNDIAGLDEVLSHFKPTQWKRNEYLLREGEICRYCYFVAAGAVQVFTIDDNGNETTRDFVIENNWVMEIQSFMSQQPGKENLRAIEPSDILAISRDSFMLLSAKIPQFEKVYRQILELSYTNSVYRLNTFVSMDALQRLKWISDNQPHLLTRLSSKMIASYLGISAETLTRLKGKL